MTEEPDPNDQLIDGFNPKRAESPATRYELLVVAKHLQLLILTARVELLAAAYGEKDRAVKAAERYLQFEADLARDLATLVVGEGTEELL